MHNTLKTIEVQRESTLARLSMAWFRFIEMIVHFCSQSVTYSLSGRKDASWFDDQVFLQDNNRTLHHIRNNKKAQEV